MQAPRWVLSNLALARQKKNLAAAVVQPLDVSVLIWHMVEWFSADVVYLYGARLKLEHTH
jgi:hypothetical protein